MRLVIAASDTRIFDLNPQAANDAQCHVGEVFGSIVEDNAGDTAGLYPIRLDTKTGFERFVFGRKKKLEHLEQSVFTGFAAADK
ncbi:hypothetical protein D3C80_1492370 [compost metagenome]